MVTEMLLLKFMQPGTKFTKEVQKQRKEVEAMQMQWPHKLLKVGLIPKLVLPSQGMLAKGEFVQIAVLLVIGLLARMEER